MSENKHTAEPWVVKGAAIRTADGIGIDVIATMQVSNQPFWDEDARRIVACVNACAGVDTECLEVAPIGIFASKYGSPGYIDQLEKQRDKLLAALTKLSGMKLNMIADGIVDKAIASVKGEQ